PFPPLTCTRPPVTNTQRTVPVSHSCSQGGDWSRKTNFSFLAQYQRRIWARSAWGLSSQASEWGCAFTSGILLSTPAEKEMPLRAAFPILRDIDGTMFPPVVSRRGVRPSAREHQHKEGCMSIRLALSVSVAAMALGLPA